ncbi:alanine racemase [Mariniflexile fucanivorans]|uniref:Alanine racemase n=1 Tax=Mariniflexile fucanivorans TaxID=264023 RepID=A0A4R1RC82_9FLAO|nr:alanine racemase [Mariniflexile fucanivorans]TCL63444.1 alanine racemase [Mariniflexile fucanivorans]
MLKAQETVLEIDLKALKHNFDHLKSRISSNTKFMAVVKAFAYGSDACEIANYLQKLPVDYFAVAFVHEGIQLREAGITKPILVLHPQAVNFNILIENCLEPSIYNVKILNEFIATASAEKLNDYPIHIKFNTGLNRLGFSENDVDTIISTVNESTSVKIESVFSHLAASEDLNEKDFTLNQIKKFKNITENMTKQMGYKPLLHMCNTSGILNYPEAHFDMVRSGIGLYGFGNSEKENKNFKPIGTLKTIISQIHAIEKGESVGYNRAYKTDTFLRTATLPIGHADGIGRQYGKGKGYVIINNQKAYILGNVCMDMIMVDVTNIDCKEGDEVIVFGPETTAENLAKTANTISYELITAISQRVKRLFIGN